MLSEHLSEPRLTQFRADVRAADHGVTVQIFCECGTKVSGDFTASYTPDQVIAEGLADQLAAEALASLGSWECRCGVVRDSFAAAFDNPGL